MLVLIISILIAAIIANAYSCKRGASRDGKRQAMDRLRESREPCDYCPRESECYGVDRDICERYKAEKGG